MSTNQSNLIFNYSTEVDNSSASIGKEAIGLPFGITFLVITSSIIAATVGGNVLVILSVFTYRPLKQVANFFIVSLAVADLLVAVLVMPFNVANIMLGRWAFGVFLCYTWCTSDILMCTASILNLCAIAIDRYFAIHAPLTYASKRTVRLVLLCIAAVWILSGIISIPPVLGWSSTPLYNPTTSKCALTDEKSFVIYSASGSFFLPLFIMTFVYVNIFVATRKRLRERARSSAAPTNVGRMKQLPKENSSSEERNDQILQEQVENGVQKFLEERQKISLSRERRAARTLGIIMGVFVLCWLPFFILYITIPFCSIDKIPPLWVVDLAVWLGFLNSALNPVIYTIFNLDFRRAFQKLLSGKCR